MKEQIINFWLGAIGISLLSAIVIRFFQYLINDEWDTFKEFYQWLWRCVLVFITISFGIFIICLGSGSFK